MIINGMQHSWAYADFNLIFHLVYESQIITAVNCASNAMCSIRDIYIILKFVNHWFLSAKTLRCWCVLHDNSNQWNYKLFLRWRHNGRDGVTNHQPHDCLLNRLFGRRSKKTSKLHVIGLCVGNSPGTGEFPTQMASNAKNVSNWWRHHAYTRLYLDHHCVFRYSSNAVRPSYRANDDKIAWVKLKKKFFGFSKDMLLGMVYFPPENSTCNTVDVFTTLLEEVSSLPQNVDKIICGDFNSRTSNLPDFFANVFHQGSDGVLWPQLQTNAEILSDKVFQSYLRDTGRLDRVSEDNARPNLLWETTFVIL